MRLRSFVDVRFLYVVSEDAVWYGLDLHDAAEAIYMLDDDPD